jgi:hypothetical protein
MHFNFSPVLYSRHDPIKTQLKYLLEANITLIQKKGSEDLEAATP